jgi:hypothetical protein
MHPHLIPAATALLLAAFVAGCSGNDQVDGMTTTTGTRPDGATLVRHTPPASGVPVTWRLEEELRIGTVGAGGPAEFGRVAGLAVAADGRIAVLDAQAQEIRVFDSDGQHLTTLGRKGGGPGELATANALVAGPDGLLRALDAGNDRISFFDLDAGFVRSHRYTPVFRSWTFDGVLDHDGTLWAVHWIPATGPGSAGRTAYVGYDSAGVPFDTLTHPDGERDGAGQDPGTWDVVRDGRRMASLGIPHYPRQLHLLDAELRTWRSTAGDPAYRLERRDPGGAVSLVIETARPLHPVDNAATDSLISRLEEQFGTKLDRSRVPAVQPAVRDLFRDDDGRLWVLVSSAASSIQTLDAYDDEDGRWLGTLSTNARLDLAPRPVIRGDQFWAVVRDELDVPYVVRARLAPAEEPAP